MTSEQRSAIFRRAAELIAIGGLCKGRPKHGDSYCSLGAIWQAAYDVGVPLYEAAVNCDLLRKAIGGVGVGDWNDAPGRTQAEVVELLKRLANGE